MGVRLDWAGLRRVALGRLRLRPAEFWALTPVELSLMLGLEAAERPLARSGLEALMRAHPDRAGDKEE